MILNNYSETKNTNRNTKKNTSNFVIQLLYKYFLGLANWFLGNLTLLKMNSSIPDMYFKQKIFM